MSRIFTGIVFVVFGLGLVVVALFTNFLILFYGIPLLIFGIFILLNRGEDKIEERKDIKKKKFKE